MGKRKFAIKSTFWSFLSSVFAKGKRFRRFLLTLLFAMTFVLLLIFLLRVNAQEIVNAVQAYVLALSNRAQL
ncbi:hypothetical protein AB0E59_18215 [Lentzea sp. NPDC034063]|uniref:hypothetical protein n=1 Tax=unclassified Lentzea TaxID=2643253 RepID=UPI0034071AEB